MFIALVTFRPESCPAEQPDTQDKSASLTYIQEHLSRIQLSRADATRLVLRPAPVLRWSNPVSGSIDAGLFVWTDGKRPQAVSKCYLNANRLGFGEAHVSLAETALMSRGTTAEIFPADERAWTIIHDLRPAKQESPRLIQMKRIARGVQVTDWWGRDKITRWELRLLPNPIFRYSDQDHGVIDGALFAFTQGTNPECLVRVELRKGNGSDSDEAGSKDRLAWHLKAFRTTWYQLQVKYREATVAEFPRLELPRPASFQQRWTNLDPFPFDVESD